MRRLDMGVASYRNPDNLGQTLASIEGTGATDWRCWIVHNPSPGDDATLKVIEQALARDRRFVFVPMPENRGYAGAVNKLFELAETEYIAYLDNDVEILTPGWDEQLCCYLDRFHEIGMIFPNGGAYQIPRGNYSEIMWAAGFAWVINRLCMSETGKFDEYIGHQNEADYALRVRMAGWKCAAAPEVQVRHHATATNDPASIERINRGVREFVDKWCGYFCGKSFNYHSPNVLRWEDWPPNALYLEEYWKMKPELQGLNAVPDTRTLDGREYDLIRVPRYKDFYRNRIV